MTHFNWIRSQFMVLAQDEKSKSILFEAYGEICCEINGQPFDCKTRKEFYTLVDEFKGENFAE